MIERTLILVKPEGVNRALIGKVITTFEDAGFRVLGLKMVKADEALAGKHYLADEDYLKSIGAKTKKNAAEKGIEIKETDLEIGQRVRGRLLKHLTSGPVVAIVFEGNEAIFVGRKLVGVTEPKKAEAGSIRGRFSNDSYEFADMNKRPLLNIIHASDEVKVADREIALWFKKEELVDYKKDFA